MVVRVANLLLTKSMTGKYDFISFYYNDDSTGSFNPNQTILVSIIF